MSVDVAWSHVVQDELWIASSGLGMKVHHENGIAQLGSFHGTIHCIPGVWLEVGRLDSNNGLRILLYHPRRCLRVHFLNIVLNLLTVHTGTHDVKECQEAGSRVID